MTDGEVEREFVRTERSPRGTQLWVQTIEWEGPHTPVSTWVPLGEPSPMTADQVEKKRKRLLSNRRYFRRCSSCEQLNPVGWMHGASLCQGCATRELGIVY